jgi:hypothetical protein
MYTSYELHLFAKKKISSLSSAQSLPLLKQNKTKQLISIVSCL